MVICEVKKWLGSARPEVLPVVDTTYSNRNFKNFCSKQDFNIIEYIFNVAMHR